ncbi:MAG: hypothetical protein RSC41_02265 [Oscillospiraceae bacterium]
MTEENRIRKWAGVLNGLAAILLVFLLGSTFVYMISIAKKTDEKEVELMNKQIEFMDYIIENNKEVITND